MLKAMSHKITVARLGRVKLALLLALLDVGSDVITHVNLVTAGFSPLQSAKVPPTTAATAALLLHHY